MKHLAKVAVPGAVQNDFSPWGQRHEHQVHSNDAADHGGDLLLPQDEVSHAD